MQERPGPVPSAGQVLVDVRAAGVQFADLMATQGLYPSAPRRPCVLGYEVAGVVAALGPGVDGVAVGDRVMAGTRFGGWAEQAVAGAGDLVPIAGGMGFEEAAAVPVAYGTAYAAVVRYGAVAAGERVLVHAAGGSVGLAATQLAKARGAEVWGTASPGKHDRLRALGLDHPLGYDDEVRERFDLVLDARGGASFRESYDRLRAGGRLIAFGASGVVGGARRDLLRAARTVLRTPRFNLLKQMDASKAVIGLNLLELWDDHGTLAPFVDPLRAELEAGVVQPVVSEVVPFARAGDAVRALAERRNLGKVVLVP